MKTLFFSLIFLSSVFVCAAQSQHYIGKSVDQVKTMMQQSGKDFFFSKEVHTGKHHFLKYENVDQTQTMLFVFKDGACSYTKLMCDYSLLKQMEDSLNNNYQYQKDWTWLDDSQDTDYEYLIELNKREWFFTIRTSRFKK